MRAEDTLRQQSFVILSRLQSGTESVVRLDAALAMIAAERERWTEAVMAELDGNGQAHAIVAYATRA